MRGLVAVHHIHMYRGANVYGFTVLIYGRLRKLWIYGRVKISTVKLCSANISSLGPCSSLKQTLS